MAVSACPVFEMQFSGSGALGAGGNGVLGTSTCAPTLGASGIGDGRITLAGLRDV